jgi:hypothetical protein
MKVIWHQAVGGHDHVILAGGIGQYGAEVYVKTSRQPAAATIMIQWTYCRPR